MRSYRELCRLDSFEERYEYLKLSGTVGKSTFGYDRLLNQLFYKSKKWKKIRDDIMIRDNGFDLGNGNSIQGVVIIHHLNPITKKDIEDDVDALYDPNNLISCSHATHMAIHYGDSNLLPKNFVSRSKNDTCPWRQ